MQLAEAWRANTGGEKSRSGQLSAADGVRVRVLGRAPAGRRTCLQRHACRRRQSAQLLSETLAALARGDKPAAKDAGSHIGATEARSDPECKL